MPTLNSTMKKRPSRPPVDETLARVSELPPIERLLYWITERHEIWRRRHRGERGPWTADPVLSKYFFCNVYRHLDRVSKWITANWIDPNADDRNLFFALVVARLVNEPESLAEIGYGICSPWKPESFARTLLNREARGETCFRRAYRVPTPQVAGEKRATYLASDVLTPIWQNRDRLRDGLQGTLREAHETLMGCFGLGSFLAAQVVADLRHVEPLRSAADRWTFAAPGPGSEQGLNILLGRPVKRHWTAWEWRHEFGKLYAEICPMVQVAKLPRLHGQNLQNCLCEFSKYERIRSGDAKGMRLYNAT